MSGTFARDLIVTLTTGTSICCQHDLCKPEVSTSDEIELNLESAVDGIAIFTARRGESHSPAVALAQSGSEKAILEFPEPCETEDYD